jgi:hypothetical protein
MMVADGTATPIAYEFVALPRIGEKIVIGTDNGTTAFRVIDVTHYANGVDGDAQALLAVTSAQGA